MKMSSQFNGGNKFFSINSFETINVYMQKKKSELRPFASFNKYKLIKNNYLIIRPKTNNENFYKFLQEKSL